MTILASSGVPEYKIVTCYDAADLELAVNEHLKDGWSLYGSTVVHGSKVLQPMLRRAKEVEVEGTEKSAKKKAKKTSA